MIFKTTNLYGALLDAAVLKALGYAHEDHLPDEAVQAQYVGVDTVIRKRWAPSQDWAQGGYVIERSYNAIIHQLWMWLGNDWPKKINAVVPSDVLVWYMRAYVASKLGDEVELS